MIRDLLFTNYREYVKKLKTDPLYEENPSLKRQAEAVKQLAFSVGILAWAVVLSVSYAVFVLLTLTV